MKVISPICAGRFNHESQESKVTGGLGQGDVTGILDRGYVDCNYIVM